MKTAFKVLATALLMVISTQSIADEARPYTDGPVINVSYIKIKPGMFDAYMKWVATERKTLMDEYKKAGIILDWRVYGAQAKGPNEPDLILTVTYKNMAAFDGLEDRQDVILKKVAGSLDKATAASIKREEMREVLGGELLRELIVK
jgi:hypothetical protein